MRPVDLRRAAAECDVAVVSGGHGATAEMLLAGKPLVEVPAALEQRLTGAGGAAIGVRRAGHRVTCRQSSRSPTRC